MDQLVRLTAGAPASALLLAAILVVSAQSLFAFSGADRAQSPASVRARTAQRLLHARHQRIHTRRPAPSALKRLYVLGLRLRPRAPPRHAKLHRAVRHEDAEQQHRDLAHPSTQPGYGSLSASGAILAVVFASIIVAPTSSIFILPLPVPIPAPLFAVGFLAYSVFAGRARTGRVNHAAHVVGAVAGIAYMAITAPGSLQRALDAWLG